MRSPYITRQGWAALHAEQDALWQRRREVVRHLAAAAAEGDRSENAEYIYRKKELREIDRRIRYLQKRIPRLTVVSGGPPDKSRVFFGAWVSLEDENGNPVDYRIVGPDEFNRNKKHISIDAPLAIVDKRRERPGESEVMNVIGDVSGHSCILVDDIVDSGGDGDNHWYHVTILEGRNREVRRLWASQGVTVSRLKRVRYGAVFLPKRLRMGQWRELDPRDHRVLREDTGLPGAASGLSLHGMRGKVPAGKPAAKKPRKRPQRARKGPPRRRSSCRPRGARRCR